MPTEFLTRDLKLAISATPEASYNGILVGASDTYLGMLTTSRDIYIPDKEKQDDTGKVGTGREFPTEQRSGYLTVPSLSISEELNIDLAALILRRAMGGADTVGADIEASLGFYPHTWGMLPNTTAAGRQLPSSSVLWSIGGADYIWGGVCIESYRVEQQGSGVPTFTANLVSSGINKRLRYLTANGLLAVNGSNAYNGPYAGSSGTEYPPAFPAPATQRYMLGAETKLQFNDGSNYVVTDAQRLKNFSLTLTNNIRTDDRRPGDPRINAANPKDGHYVNRLLHGDRTVAAEMTLVLDDTMREFSDAYNDTIITSFKYTARGLFLKKALTPFTESTTNQTTLELTIPKCYFRSVRGSDDNGDAIITISVFPVDDLTNGLLTAKVINNTNTAIS